MFAAMEFAREQGFIVHVRNPGVVFGHPTSQRLTSSDTDDLPIIPVTAIDLTDAYPVAALMAPVFDERGKVSFCLVMAGFHAAMTGAHTLEAGRNLRAACDRISGFVAGKAQLGHQQPV